MKRRLLSRLSRLGRSTGQDDNTAPILAILMNRKTLGCFFELLETLLLTLVIFMVIQAFVAQPYQVQQPSMENTLMPDQYVLVDKLTPHFDDYHRGDIVVFTPPTGWAQDASGTPYIKRVIAVAGETIDIHGGHVYVNGNLLSEPYIFEGQTTDMQDGGSKTWKLETGQIFVMGDHRQASQDSRDFGPVEKSSVIGRAWLRYWPSNQFGLIPQAKQTAAPAPSVSPVPSKTP
jgi:signal peptidase I